MEGGGGGKNVTVCDVGDGVERSPNHDVTLQNKKFPLNIIFLGNFEFIDEFFWGIFLL